MIEQTKLQTQLWIGDENALAEEAMAWLRSNFCPQKQRDCYCTSCRQVSGNTHPSIVWVRPERGYTLDDIAVVFEKTSFALEEDEQFYFVLEHTHLFTAAVSNRLLKVLEEPPAGYNFLLLSSNIDSMMETIVSRCYVREFGSAQHGSSHPLLLYFTQAQSDAQAFSKELRASSLSDVESTQLLHELFAWYGAKHKAQLENGPKDELQLEATLTLLRNAMAEPPQSGSSSIFWKNLYLQFSLEISSKAG